MNRKRNLAIIIGFFAIFLLSWTVSAQQTDDDGTCPALVQRAILEMGENCNNLLRNSACYGYDRVNAVFNEEIPSGFFTAPADRAELVRIDSLETAPLDLENETWGVAVMSVQANLPNTLPGQAVTFVLMGDSAIENAVDPNQAQPYIVPVVLTLPDDTDGFSVADPNATVIDIIPAGTQVLADSRDDIGWVRVVYNDMPLWIRGESVPDVMGLEALPILDADSFTPMQAFYFSTGVGQATCNDAPNVISVQSPDGIEVALNVNGADISIGSLITMQSVAEGEMVFSVHEGHLDVVDDEIMVVAGESVDVTVDEDGNINEWDAPRPSTDDEMALGGIIEPAFVALDMPVDLPETTGNPDQVIHIVQAGETLFSIARSYEASMPAIVRVNGIADIGNIFVGQRLVIPNPGSGFVGINVPTEDVSDEVDVTVSGDVDCTGFVATSPFEGLAFGLNTFYWNVAASGVDSYRVLVTNAETGQSVSFIATGDSVSGLLDAETIGFGFSFTWQVDALRDGQVVCSGERIRVSREAEVTPVFSASWACSGSYQATIVWSGLDTRTVVFNMVKDSVPYSTASLSNDTGVTGITRGIFICLGCGESI